MHLEYRHVWRKDTPSECLFYFGERIHLLSAYFVLVYTPDSAVSSRRVTLSECLFFFGIHPYCSSKQLKGKTFWVSIFFRYTPGVHSCPLLKEYAF